MRRAIVDTPLNGNDATKKAAVSDIQWTQATLILPQAAYAGAKCVL